MVADHYFQPYSTWWGGDNILGNALAAWNVQNNGAGSTSVTPQIDETKPFARRMQTGTTSTGRVAMNVKATTTLLFSSTSHIRSYRFAFRVPTLSDATQTFVIRGGYLDSVTTTAPTDGAYFEFDANTDTEVQCVTASNSTRTTTDSGVTSSPAPGTTGSSSSRTTPRVAFYLGVLGTTPSLVATITTNIPSGTSRTFYAGACIAKSAGTTSRDFDVWFQRVHQDRAAA
jgi:hypothetical protein